jgi:hypothetical protein
MRSCGKLVNKEKAKSNFKLVFIREQRTFFAFLHGEETRIFNNLRIGIDYSFFIWKKKGCKYSFVKSLSIKEFNQTSFKPVKQMNVQNLFIHKISKQMKLREMTHEAIDERINQVKNTTRNNLAIAKLEWLKEKLDKRHFNLLTKKDKDERERTQELRLLFYSDFIYKG